jgi:protein-L-isoaspartate O-methyltransferase
MAECYHSVIITSNKFTGKFFSVVLITIILDLLDSSHYNTVSGIGTGIGYNVELLNVTPGGT